MKPLIFLAVRSVVNGFKRAFSSPKRLIGVIFTFAMWSNWLWRPFLISTQRAQPHRYPGSGQIPAIPYPGNAVVEAGVFICFAILSLLLMTTVYGFNRTMRAADVDVLFPTPIHPRVVMGFRIARDYLSTILFPLFFGVIYGSSFTFSSAKAASVQSTVGMMFKAGLVAWFLLSLCWTLAGYSLNLYGKRSDGSNERVFKVYGWAISILFFGIGAYVYFSFRGGMTSEKLVAIFGQPLLRIPFFSSHLATMFTTGPLMSSTNMIWSSLGFVVLISLGLVGALSQAEWLYDQSAVSGGINQAALAARRQGDSSILLAEHARTGKLKTGKQNFLHRMVVPRALVPIWREALVQIRTKGFIGLLVSQLPLFIVIIVFIETNVLELNDSKMGMLLILTLAVTLYMGTLMQANMGFLELLRRTDLLKPLPFSAHRLMFAEVMAKVAGPLGFSLFLAAIAACIHWGLWQYTVAYFVFSTTFAVLLSASTLTIMLLFPDIEDPNSTKLPRFDDDVRTPYLQRAWGGYICRKRLRAP